jgi:hypothetical protein
MKPRYDAYYRLIPNLGGQQPGPELTERTSNAVRATRGALAQQLSVLEATHPEIVQAITLLWGYPEMNTYFEKLWLSDGNQQPIAPEAMSELMLLAGVHRWLTPERPQHTLASIYGVPPNGVPATNTRKHDVWDSVPKRR